MDENKVPEKTKLKNYIKYYQIQEDIEEQSKLVEESDGFFDKFIYISYSNNGKCWNDDTSIN